MQTEWYKKDKRSAQIHGQNFEYKFCALTYLRAKNKGLHFKLASNVEGLGKFDDLFVEYLDENSREKNIFVQLKSRTTKWPVNLGDLLDYKGPFSLSAYYYSYIEMEKKFNCSGKGVKLKGSIDESLFILYTNADFEQTLKSYNVTDFNQEEFLMTGGSVLRFDEEKHKEIYQHLQKLPKHRECLSILRIIYNQPDEKQMDCHIKRELQLIMKLPESWLDITYMYFIDIMKEWWQHEEYFLKDTNSRQNDPLRKTSEKVKATVIAKMKQRNSELDELGIKYEESAIKDIQQLTENHKPVLIFAPGKSTTLTATKIHQMLCGTEHVILKLQQLIRCKTEVMSAWKSMFDVLVLESDSSAEVPPDIFEELSGFLKSNIAEKKLIFISKSVGNIEQKHELRKIFKRNLTEEYDSCKFMDIVTESRKLFLNKYVSFQGMEVKLSTIVKNDDIHVLNELNCESISLLLENEKPSIGMRTEDTVNYYIERTLQSRKQANTGFPGQGERQLATSGHILLGMKDSSTHLDENLGKESATGWKPSTLLEGDGQIILVTDEPGMGKSTLLTHLSQQTQEPHPEMWIVRVNINNYTRILNKLQKKGSDEMGVIKLLTEAAQIKKSDRVVLEGRLFNYTYNSTGNMVVLIDGVDEVIPRYTEEVIKVLKILSKTEVKRIWVTSRNSVRDRLETEFQCQSYSLVPFSEKDQKNFLVKFWKGTCPEIEDDNLENLANRVVKLSSEHLTAQDKNFMGIPLQSWLLAEMFKGSVKECSTATVQLPEYINTVMLYDFYVETKWDIYLSDKKLYDRTNVNAQNDDVELHKSFKRNHVAAALVAILSTQQLDKFHDKTIAEGAREFLGKITTGLEKTGIIIEVMEGRPVFQHRTLAEYLAATWLCDNFQHCQTFMRDHLFESVFDVVRSMVDRILADKCPLHGAVLNRSMIQVEKLLQKESITQKDRGGRTPLHVAVSCRRPELIKLFLENGADVSSMDNLLRLSPVQYAIRMDDWEMLSLLMEKRPDIREQVLNGTNRDCADNIACALRAAAQYGHNDLLKYLISERSSVNMALPRDNSTVLHVAARSQQTETVKTLLLLGASIDCQDESGKTPLHVSVETANLEVIKCLVEHQETVQRETELQHVVNPERTLKIWNFLNIPDIKGNTPMHLGVVAGNTNIVSYLMGVGSDKNVCNLGGEYPLTLATGSGKNDIVGLLLNDVSGVQCEAAKIGALTAAIVAGQVDTTAVLLRSGTPVNGGGNENPMHIASRMGHKEIVGLLMQYGASLTSRTDSGNTAMHLASENGHLSLVKYLVEEGGEYLNILNYENETPLLLAARNGKDSLITYFAGNGCNINAPSANGATCLHVACENGHYTTVECLLKHRADVNALNFADQTPLHIASSRGQTKIVELLLLQNAKLSLRDKDGITVLLAASINGHQDTVRFIVQHGGNIEDTDGKGNTIAHFAVANENYDILNFLWQKNVSLDVQNSDRDSPLLKAVREGRNRMVQYLVDRNCDMNTQDNDGMFPLDVAVLKGNKQITRILLERNARSAKTSTHIVAAAKFGFLDWLKRFVVKGVDINVKTDDGESLLHVACGSDQVATVTYLCEHGAVLNWQDNNGNTALHVAVSNGHLDVTRVLVDKGADLNTADTAGSTALHMAAKGGYLNIVQYLADSFAPIDRRNAKKETALLVAAAEGHEEIVRLLIEQGAGIGVRDIEGKRAFDIATEKCYGLITELLRDRAEGRTLVCSKSHTDIHFAAESDDFEHLQRSLKGGMSIETAIEEFETDAAPEDTLQVHSNRRTALHTAAENGSLEEVQRLVEGGIALDYGDAFGRTALWVAAKRGHKDIIKFLLENDSCKNIPDCEGVTPIAIAAQEDHWKAVGEFLEHDPTTLPRDAECLTIHLHKATESGDLEALRTILKSSINVDATNQIGSTALHVAAEIGHIEVCRILLKSGASVNAVDKNDKTPLILAAEKGGIEIVRELLTATAVEDLLSPLFSAATQGHADVVRELLKHGASVNIVNEPGAMPLTSAAARGRVEVVRELVNHGAKVDIKDAFGRTPLSAAATIGHSETVRELLNHGASVDIADIDGRTPLTIAASKGHLETARELLKHGASVNIAGIKGRTPLIRAASEGQEEIVRELLNRGAEVDIRDAFGKTALNNAASMGHLETVRELLKLGASVDIADRHGRTPLITAASKGHEQVFVELLNHGASVDVTDAYGNTPLSAAARNMARDRYELIKALILCSPEQACNVSFKYIYCVEISFLKILVHIRHTHTHTHTLGLSEGVTNTLHRLLPTKHTRNTTGDHPYPQRHSNPRPKQPIASRPTPYPAWANGSGFE